MHFRCVEGRSFGHECSGDGARSGQQRGRGEGVKPSVWVAALATSDTQSHGLDRRIQRADDLNAVGDRDVALH